MRATPFSVGRQGSTWNVSRSGIAIMSDSSIRLKPVIEEPSKPIPSVNAPSSSSIPTAKLFSWPRMSVNQRRTKEMPSLSARPRMSCTLVLASGIAVVLSVVAIAPHFLSSKSKPKSKSGLWLPSQPRVCHQPLVLDPGLRRDEDRPLDRRVGLLAVLHGVHPEGFLVLAHAQRHHESEHLQEQERHGERIQGSGQRRERLVPQLPDVPVHPSIRDAIPGLLGEEPDEQDPGEARDPVRGQH